MRFIVINFLGFLLFACTSNEVKINHKIAEVSCGQCQFNAGGDGCDLAVRINNKVYFVKGNGIDDYGDAHAANGFCNRIRKAKLSGTITNDSIAITNLSLED